jgi:hypothetical protein
MSSEWRYFVAAGCLCAVMVLGWTRRTRKPAPKVEKSAEIREFLDWVSEEEVLSDATPVGNGAARLSPSHNDITRGLASLGMSATSPRHARSARDSRGVAAHPATENEEIADEVVRIQRVSEEEESERYFAAFSQYRSK